MPSAQSEQFVVEGCAAIQEGVILTSVPYHLEKESGVTLASPRHQGFCLRGNMSGNKQVDLAKGKRELLFVVRIERKALKLQFAAERLMIERLQLPPVVHSWLVCMACIASVRSLSPYRERRLVRLQSR